MTRSRRKPVLDQTRVLIVEDEMLWRRRVATFLADTGAEVTQAGTTAEAKRHAAAAETAFDVVLLDVNLPDGLGTDLLKTGVFGDGPVVIVMTAQGGVTGAVEAIRLGAADYLTKPFDVEEIPLRVQRALEGRQRARAEKHRQEHSLNDELFFGPSLATLRQQMELIIEADGRLAAEHPPILIEGETGTGKTTIARWLHRRGPRVDAPLVEVNCSALPESLAESELFGHERGAFTDAKAARIGLIEAADGGTLFLDELSSLVASLQAKLLTAIEDRTIRRVGGNRMITADARIIAATNANLEQLVREGRFREDLLHRLDLFRLRLPPLRERGEDVIELAQRLVDRTCKRYGVQPAPIPAVGRQRLLSYPWPGNVRELAHEVERAVVFERGDLRFEALARRTPTPRETAGTPSTSLWLNPEFQFPPSGFVLEDAIDQLVLRALEQVENNVSAAARLLGTSRDFVRYRLRSRISADSNSGERGPHGNLHPVGS